MYSSRSIVDESEESGIIVAKIIMLIVIIKLFQMVTALTN